MKKMVIVINGAGGVGKDTICDIVSNHFGVMNISSIEPVKNLAIQTGWNGEKTVKSRKYLSDLKQVLTDFDDLPLKYLLKKYEEFQESDCYDILFVHIREPLEILKFKNSVDCVTLLIRGKEKRHYGNPSDDNVENFKYDYYYKNDTSLEDVEVKFMDFFKDTIFKYFNH